MLFALCELPPMSNSPHPLIASGRTSSRAAAVVQSALATERRQQCHAVKQF